MNLNFLSKYYILIKKFIMNFFVLNEKNKIVNNKKRKNMTSNLNYYFYSKFFMYLSNFFFKSILYNWLFFTILSFYFGLFNENFDYKQQNFFKIIYLHLPVAWWCSIIYIILIFLLFFFIFKKYYLSFYFLRNIIFLGCYFSGVTLFTGSCWAHPAWGTFWVWDVRLTSVLILFLIFLLFYILSSMSKMTFYVKKISTFIFILIGLLFPFFKFSVYIWPNLHQISSVTITKTAIHSNISILLILFFFYFLLTLILYLFLNIRIEFLKRKKKSLIYLIGKY